MRVITVATNMERSREGREGSVARLLEKAVSLVAPEWTAKIANAAEIGGSGGHGDHGDIAARVRAAMRECNADVCILDAGIDLLGESPEVADIADLVVVPVDAGAALSPGVVQLAEQLGGSGIDFVFVVCGAPLADVDDVTLMALVQRGTVAPWSIEAPATARAEDEDVLALVRYLFRRAPEGRRYEADGRAGAAEGQEDRRAFRRWTISWPLSVITDKGRQEATLVDISGSGLGFKSEAAFSAGQSIQVAIPSLGTFDAEVVRSNGDLVGARFRIPVNGTETLAAKIQHVMDMQRHEWLRAKRDGGRSGSPGAMPGDGRGQLAPARTGRIIAVVNTKGGTGKSTLAIHLAAAMAEAGRRVVTADLDQDQGTFTQFLENRRARPDAGDLLMPAAHYDGRRADDGEILDAIEQHAREGANVIVDTAGRHDASLRELLASCDHVVTPVNDSFLDLAAVAGDRNGRNTDDGGSVAAMVREARAGGGETRPEWWIVRTRLTPLFSRNKARIADAIADLAREDEVRAGEGLMERVIYRELYREGLTVFDIGRVDGSRLRLSHLAAKQEVRTLLWRLLDATPRERERPAAPRSGPARVATLSGVA